MCGVEWWRTPCFYSGSYCNKSFIPEHVQTQPQNGQWHNGHILVTHLSCVQTNTPWTNRLDVAWTSPLRSPDLTPLESFQLEYIKITVVHQHKNWESDVWLTVHRNSVWKRNQLDVTFVLSFISPLQITQHVSGNHVPIFRRWLRSVITTYWYCAVAAGRLSEPVSR